MTEAKLSNFQLEPFQEQIAKVARPCLIGTVAHEPTGDFFGGMPMVDDPFVWPQKDGYPLNFVGQVQCCRFQSLPMQDGYLLFFYDNRHWGYSPKDKGHAVVLHQHGSRVLNKTELPEREVRSLFGLLKKVVTPRIYQQVHVLFDGGLSYPSLDRGLLQLGDEVAEECYIEFCESILAPVQIGGFPRPVQSDDMEQTCAKVTGLGEKEDWVVLLQLSEIGDFIWGDAGMLYWFIHRADLESGRLDRAWLVTQCC